MMFSIIVCVMNVFCARLFGSGKKVSTREPLVQPTARFAKNSQRTL